MPLYIPQGTPNFKVTLTGGNQSPSSGTITKVALDTVVADTHSYWSTANKNYLPLIAGTYAFFAQVTGQATNWTANNSLALFISKNGIAGGAGTALTNEQFAVVADALSRSGAAFTITSMNGSTDTMELDAAVTGTSPVFESNALPKTFFGGWRIGP